MPRDFFLILFFFFCLLLLFSWLCNAVDLGNKVSSSILHGIYTDCHRYLIILNTFNWLSGTIWTLTLTKSFQFGWRRRKIISKLASLFLFNFPKVNQSCIILLFTFYFCHFHLKKKKFFHTCNPGNDRYLQTLVYYVWSSVFVL